MTQVAEVVRTMEFIGKDDFDAPVYKCLEDESLWKDISLGKSVVDLRADRGL